MDCYYSETFTYRGREFVARFYPDEDATPLEFDHGTELVSDWTTRDKYPGERIVSSTARRRRYYNWQEAMAIARKEGWDFQPYGGTKGQRAARAVEAHFERLRDWFNDEWHYCGISVTLADEDDEDFNCALWGIEDDAPEYHKLVMEELAGEYFATVITPALEASARAMEESRPDLYGFGHTLPQHGQMA